MITPMFCPFNWGEVVSSPPQLAVRSFRIVTSVFFVSQYDPRFGDAFWNSSKYNMVSYLLRMMTSWAIVVNVWYLPPMTIQVHGADSQSAASV